MKNFLALLCTLIMGGVISAQTTITVVDGTNAPYNTYGTRNNSATPNTFTSNAASGMAGLVITAPLIDRAQWWSTYCLALKTANAQTDETMTITAPDGYLIRDISMEAQAVSSTYPYYVTLNGDRQRITGASSYTFNATELKQKTVDITLNCDAASVGNWLALRALTITVELEPGDTYLLRFKDTGYYVTENFTTGTTPVLMRITPTGSTDLDGLPTYKIQRPTDNQYVTYTSAEKSSGKDDVKLSWSATNASNTFTIEDTGTSGYVRLKPAKTSAGQTLTSTYWTAWNTGANQNIVFWNATDNLSNWKLEKVVTNLSKSTTTKAYAITNPRAWWAVGYGNNEINSTDAQGLSLDKDVSDPRQQFAIIPYKGKYYLYSVADGKFAYQDNKKLSLNSYFHLYPKGSLTFTQSTNNDYKDRYPTVLTVNGCYFGVSTGITPNIYNYQATNDGGNASLLVEAADFDATEALAKLPIDNLSELTNTKAYYLATERGALGISSGNLVSSAQAYTPTAMAIINYNSQYYLFDTTNGRFVNSSGAATNYDIEPITFTALGDSRFMPKFGNGKVINITATLPAGLNLSTWDTGDDGNQYYICPAEDFDPTEALDILANPPAEKVYTYVTDLSALSNGKAYAITNKRGTWNATVSSDRLGTYSTLDTDLDSEKFAILQYDGEYYIYSIAAKKVLTYENNLKDYNEYPKTPVSITSTGNATYPWFFSFDSSHNINVNSAGGVVIDDWTSKDDGNQNAIIEVEDFDPTQALELLQTLTVPYKLKFNGETMKESNVRVKIGQAPATLPASMDNGLMTYAYEPATIAKTTSEVSVTATWNGPFQLSEDYASAKWSFLKLQGTNYITYNSASTPNISLLSHNSDMSDDALWAFIGNPYTGLTIVNKGAGESVKLVSGANPETDGNTGGNTKASMEESSGNEVWIPKRSNLIDNGFFLYEKRGAYALNNRSTTLAFWTTAVSIGSTFTIEDISAYVNELEPWFTTHVGDNFGLSVETYDTWKDRFEAYRTNCTTDEYLALKEAVDNGKRLPETGYYRIKSVGARSWGEAYLTCTTGEGLVTSTDTGNDAASVFLWQGSFPNYTMKVQDLNLQPFTGESQPLKATGDAGCEFTVDILSPGVVTIKSPSDLYSRYQDYCYVHEGNAHQVVAWEPSAAASHWTVEDAEDIKLTLNAATDLSGHSRTYATMYLPFDVTLPTGVTAYALTSPKARNANDPTLVIFPKSIGQEVPAGTPVMLAGDNAGPIEIAIGTVNAEAPDDNIMQGTYLGETSTGESHLVLNKNSDGHIGFFNLTATRKLGANKAFIPYSTVVNSANPEVRGMCISWDLEVGKPTIADVTHLVNLILGKEDDNDLEAPAMGFQFTDVNGDGRITIADVTALINKILGK